VKEAPVSRRTVPPFRLELPVFGAAAILIKIIRNYAKFLQVHINHLGICLKKTKHDNYA
jgi:hypothetical protein